MKVKVSQLKPNPFRRIDKYPIVYDKVEALKTSINDTGFWDNILARPKPGHSKITAEDIFVQRPEHEEWDYGEEIVVGPESEDGYIGLAKRGGGGYVFYSEPILEIAYGHHRLKAIQELGIEEVDIPVRELDDETMIKIMANENMEDWELNTSVINETIRVVRDFLSSDASDEQKCQITAKQIKTFLGDNWPLTRIQEAMANLDEKRYNREAIETFKTPTHARAFRSSVSQYNRNETLLDHNDQKQIAQEIIEEVSQKVKPNEEPELTSADIKKKVYEKATEKLRGRGQPSVSKQVVDAYYVQALADLGKVSRAISDLSIPFKDLNEEHKDKVREKIQMLIEKLEEYINE